MQRHVCTLVGLAAKRKGAKKAWWRTQTLYWQGVEYPRKSRAYQELLDRAYEALNQKFWIQKGVRSYWRFFSNSFYW